MAAVSFFMFENGGQVRWEVADCGVILDMVLDSFAEFQCRARRLVVLGDLVHNGGNLGVNFFRAVIDRIIAPFGRATVGVENPIR